MKNSPTRAHDTALDKTKTSATNAPFVDLNFSISNDVAPSKIYDQFSIL